MELWPLQHFPFFFCLITLSVALEYPWLYLFSETSVMPLSRPFFFLVSPTLESEGMLGWSEKTFCDQKMKPITLVLRVSRDVPLRDYFFLNYSPSSRSCVCFLCKTFDRFANRSFREHTLCHVYWLARDARHEESSGACLSSGLLH